MSLTVGTQPRDGSSSAPPSAGQRTWRSSVDRPPITMHKPCSSIRDPRVLVGMGASIFLIDTELVGQIEGMGMVFAGFPMIECIGVGPDSGSSRHALTEKEMAEALPPSDRLIIVAYLAGAESEAKFAIELDVTFRTLRWKFCPGLSFTSRYRATASDRQCDAIGPRDACRLRASRKYARSRGRDREPVRAVSCEKAGAQSLIAVGTVGGFARAVRTARFCEDRAGFGLRH